MTRISSKQTWFQKKIFPAIWLGMALLFLGYSAFELFVNSEWLGLLILFGAAATFCYFGTVVFKKYVWNLADVVEDYGDYLILYKESTKERVSFNDILEVEAHYFQNPPTITLSLREPNAFGFEVAFIPRMSILTFPRAGIAKDLTDRARQARLQVRT